MENKIGKGEEDFRIWHTNCCNHKGTVVDPFLLFLFSVSSLYEDDCVFTRELKPTMSLDSQQGHWRIHSKETCSPWSSWHLEV